MKPENASSEEVSRVGLCADCEHMRRVSNDRGSTFYLCELSRSDPRFPRYPRLPVLQCIGYSRKKSDNA